MLLTISNQYRKLIRRRHESSSLADIRGNFLGIFESLTRQIFDALNSNRWDRCSLKSGRQKVEVIKKWQTEPGRSKKAELKKINFCS